MEKYSWTRYGGNDENPGFFNEGGHNWMIVESCIIKGKTILRLSRYSTEPDVCRRPAKRRSYMFAGKPETETKHLKTLIG